MDAALPLSGKTILVTRSAGQSSQFTQLLQQAGATVLEMPTLEITPPSSWAALDQAIAGLDQFNWLILTSTNAVDYFLERLTAQSQTLDRFSQLKVAVVGQKTAARLQQQGREPDFIPPNFVADALVEQFPESAAGLKILFPRVETGGREILVKAFTARGAEVVEVPAYQSGCAQSMPPEIAAALRQEHIDLLTFASSKTVSCFCQLLQTCNPPILIAAPPHLPLVASIGPQTSATCQQQLGRLDIEAQDYTLEGLTQAIITWVQQAESTAQTV